MLMSIFKLLVNSSVKESFYGKKKKLCLVIIFVLYSQKLVFENKKKKQLGYVLIFFNFTCETYFF